MCDENIIKKITPINWNKKLNQIHNNALAFCIPKRLTHSLTNKDFHGLIAPVFTCMRYQKYATVDTSNIDAYAKYLKSHKVIGVLVNSIVGEGPALNSRERRRNAESWFDAAYRNDLLVIEDIGGAPISDVIHMAKHADALGVHAVMVQPDPIFKPKNLEQLLGYCKIIAQNCNTRAFFYNHDPKSTGVDLDMPTFSKQAADAIPNFMGIHYSDNDLAMGIRCAGNGRVVSLGLDRMMSSGIMMGFNTVLSPVINIKPDVCWDILSAIHLNDLPLAQSKQEYLNGLIYKRVTTSDLHSSISDLKRWFNDEMQNTKTDISVGPAREVF